MIKTLTQWGWACVSEMPLDQRRRRADIMALSAKGDVVIIEVKSGLADFRADSKWRDYLAYCDHFAFAVDETFPLSALPEDAGVFICDGWQAELLRPWSHHPLHASRRKALTLAFARLAALRLVNQDNDPIIKQ
jgi:hypothetical protein